MVQTIKETVHHHVKSQSYAWNGLYLIIVSQLNFRIEMIATIAVISAGIFFKITLVEWYGVLFSCALVMLAEALNSSIEKACDAITTKRHGAIRYAKDVSAGAVLVAAFAALAIGYLVFAPYVITFLGLS
jgi:diacylglycerol kinase